MSTRSSISVCEVIDGKEVYRSIYCHFDGYLGGVGEVLKESYNTIDRVCELISLGDASYITDKLCPEGRSKNSFSGADKDTSACMFYHRDRGDAWEDCKPIEVFSEQELVNKWDVSYNYLFKDGEWLVRYGYNRNLETDPFMTFDEFRKHVKE